MGSNDSADEVVWARYSLMGTGNKDKGWLGFEVRIRVKKPKRPH